MRPDLKRKRPTVKGLPAANPKADSRAQTDSAMIPPHGSRCTRFREYLALATIYRAPRIYRRFSRKGGNR